MYFELCKHEEEADLIGKAKEEAVKAIGLDYGSLSEDILLQVK